MSIVDGGWRGAVLSALILLRLGAAGPRCDGGHALSHRSVKDFVPRGWAESRLTHPMLEGVGRRRLR